MAIRCGTTNSVVVPAPDGEGELELAEASRGGLIEAMSGNERRTSE